MMFPSKTIRCASVGDGWGTRPALALGVLIAVMVMWWAEPTLQTANAQSGGEYLVRKSTIDGGGVTFHTGATYRLGGTVGQHDAGGLTGGEYKLTGGFWGPTEATPCPVLDPDPLGYSKTRFISIAPLFCPTSPGGVSALRVKLVSLYHVVPPYTGGDSVPFTSFEGQVRWVGPPVQYVESTSNATPFYAASLQCDPH